MNSNLSSLIFRAPAFQLQFFTISFLDLLVTSHFLLLLICLNPRLSFKCFHLPGAGERIQAFPQKQTCANNGHHHNKVHVHGTFNGVISFYSDTLHTS